jgi:hypothetical protein
MGRFSLGVVLLLLGRRRPAEFDRRELINMSRLSFGVRVVSSCFQVMTFLGVSVEEGVLVGGSGGREGGFEGGSGGGDFMTAGELAARCRIRRKRSKSSIVRLTGVDMVNSVGSLCDKNAREKKGKQQARKDCLSCSARSSWSLLVV